MTTVPVTDGYPRLLLGMCLLAAGVGCTMAPATESIMGSLPPSKAGVGSAMNDTTRQMGGALGVAVIGSVFAAVYRPGMTDALAGSGLSGEQLAVARDSVGGAMQVAAELPAAAGSALADIARVQFVDGMSTALWVAVVAVVAAAVIVFAFLPARAADFREEEESPLDGLASLTFAEAESVLERDSAVAAGALDEARSGGHGRAAGSLRPSFMRRRTSAPG
jgi:cbb3-type cytochrome oxidase subunit 3